jgi:hypothetical protein
MTKVDDFVNLSRLRQERSSRQAQIERLIEEQKALDARIRVAAEIRSVTPEGVVLSNTLRTLNRVGGYARTIPLEGETAYRSVDVYESARTDRPGWAVRTLEHAGAWPARPREWVLGLDHRWSKAKAVRVAYAWLVFGRILED